LVRPEARCSAIRVKELQHYTVLIIYELVTHPS
jgi:hypothetical protein